MGYPIQKSPLFGVKSTHRLAKVLQTRIGRLENLASLKTQYSEGTVIQKGKVRKTETPIRTMRRLHNRAQSLISRIKPPDYLHSGCKGRSYLTNANAHRGCLQNFQVDISKFYQSTTWHQVYLCFHKLFQCNSDVAGMLASLLTYENHIPTGSPVSSLLSYFTHKQLFDDLNDEALKRELTMTLLQDDISFSGDKIDEAFRCFVRKSIKRQNLKPKRGKQRYYHGGKPPKITGIIVMGDRLVVPWLRHHQMKQAVDAFYGATSGEEIRSLYNRAIGRISEIEHVQGKIYDLKDRLKSHFRKRLAEISD